jgi:hypothetical protein
VSEERATPQTASSFDARIVLRPRSLDETLDLALRYLRTSARQYLEISLIIVGSQLAILGAASVSFDLSFWQKLGVAFFLTPIAERVVTLYERRNLFGNDARIGPAVFGTLRRLPFSLATSSVISLPWLGMLMTDFNEGWVAVGCLFGAFWPFVLASHVYIGEAAFLEQIGAGDAARRTRTLLMFRFARGLGLVLICGLVRALFAAGFYLMIEFVLGILLPFPDLADVVGGWLVLAGYVLAGPYIAMVRLFDYIDARTGSEGWDIQVRFNAIKEAAEADERRLAA